MSKRYLQRLTAVAALGLATMAAAAACTSAVPAQPTPTTTASAGATSPVPAVSRSTTAQPVPVTADPTTTRPQTGSACRGAVIYRLDASDTGPPWKPLCMTVGGVLLVS